MVGAIIGDIAGSLYEYDNVKTKRFGELIKPESFRTDDTVLTCCVAQLLTDYNPEDITEKIASNYLKKIVQAYPYEDYGEVFKTWAKSEKPYRTNSCGNGSAMRIAPVGYACDSLQDTIKTAITISQTSHDHIDGIRGACATAGVIYLARTGQKLGDIAKFFSGYYRIPNLRKLPENYASMPWTCANTVPQAFACFFESYNFEDAIRRAISIGGDSDTLACITGAMAEAYYGAIPEKLKEEYPKKLDLFLLGTLQDYHDKYESNISTW